MSDIGLILNGLLGVLLVGALVLGWRLEGRLKALRASHQSFKEAVEDLDRDGSGRGVAPIVELARRPHDVLRATQSGGGEGVDHAEVRVLTEAGGDEERLVAAKEVEVVAVVEVAVAGPDGGDRFGDLVDGQVVKR